MKKMVLMLLLFGSVPFFILGCSGTKEKKTQAPKVAVPLYAGLDDLAGSMSADLLAKKKKRIAIAPFSDIDGKVPDFGLFLTDELGDRILAAPKLDVVERLQVQKQLKTHNLNLSGTLDEAALKEAGRILGVDAIVLGTFTVMDKTIRLRTRLIATETARVFTVLKRDVILDDDIKKLMSEKKAISRWDLSSEKGKKLEYDKRINRALHYINQATKMKPLHSGQIEKRKALYKAALLEIELALSIYPKDPRSQKMKEQIREALK